MHPFVCCCFSLMLLLLMMVDVDDNDDDFDEEEVKEEESNPPTIGNSPDDIIVPLSCSLLLLSLLCSFHNFCGDDPSFVNLGLPNDNKFTPNIESRILIISSSFDFGRVVVVSSVRSKPNETEGRERKFG